MSSPRVALSFRPEALRELDAASDWYFVRDPDAGIAFALELDGAIERIRSYPEIGRSEGDEIRSLRLASFPYRVYYWLTGAAVEVLAIAHASRSPGYWRGRS